MKLVEVKRNEVYCDSHTIAVSFGLKHVYVSRVAKQLMEDVDKGWVVGDPAKCFVEERSYRTLKYTAYIMNRKFFSLLAMRFKGKKATRWQSLFIDAFDEALLYITKANQNANDTLWLTQRKQCKIARKEETDVIKEFVDYATKQGSKNAKFYYKHITNSAYSALHLMVQKKPKLRDTMDVYEISELLLAERIAKKSLKKYMKLGRHYKDIYESVKDDLLNFGGRLGIV